MKSYRLYTKREKETKKERERNFKEKNRRKYQKERRREDRSIIEKKRLKKNIMD